MRANSAAVLLVAVLVLSSLSFAVPVDSSDSFETADVARERPVGAFGDAGAPGPTRPGADPTATDPGPLAGFEPVHESGITGEGVRVGVVGTGFATGGGQLTDAVVDSRRFAADDPGLLADTSHDTAVAEIVHRSAPDAELLLAGIGRDGGPDEYAAAVSWLRERGADVAVDAGSYFPASAEGWERFDETAAAATENGTAFVTSAGNYADRHWRGVGESGWLAFENDTRYNALGEGPVSGQVSLRLYWWGDADYDLYLYRADAGEDTLVAKSAANVSGGGRHTEAIDASLPSAQYYVAVEGGPEAGGTPVELFSSRHDLSISTETGGMAAPSTAEGVVAVGAVDAVTGEPRPYSSSGPALDISAPDGAATAAAGEFYGSSAAAPLVAGTLTLMVAQNESLTPAAAQRALRGTAARSNGRLYLDAPSAVRAVDPAAPMDHVRDRANATRTGD
ncbi:S8 family serine peptidase [Halolamina litorea]|uniref:S8 family serine peptidase n=1 Tax=Halolamina litorea TaxID=1515593 RepID=A0ABD6BRX2_9EURY